ncbi:MAG: PH domain-containing protein [Candidatus Wildermuthbacteria bacterium]|nr:PH domain-containing protein [Candidatus Wildermuthbacteria bacterium]
MKQLHPRAVWLFFLTSMARVGVWLFIIFSYFLSVTYSLRRSELFLTQREEEGSGAWILLGGLAIIAVLYGWAKLTYHFYKYQLTDHDFRKESGVIAKAYVAIPYDRIQNVDIYRGIIARMLGLSDVHIQTAGTSATFGRYGASGLGAEGRLPGLSAQDAEAVRDELMVRARQSKTQNQGL